MYDYKYFYFEKLTSLGLPLIVFLTIVGTYFYSYFYVIIGTGHITIAFLYQFKSLIKKDSYVKCFSYLLIVLFILYIIYELFEWNVIIMQSLAGIYFVLHALRDELNINKLYKLKNHFRLIHILPVSFLFLSYYLYLNYLELSSILSPLFLNIIYYCFIIFLLFSFILYIRAFLTNAMLFNIVYPTIFFSFPLFITLKSIELLGLYVIYHYTSWYIFYYFKLGNEEKKRRIYIKDVITINVVILICFILLKQFDIIGVGNTYTSLNLITFFLIFSYVHFITSNIFPYVKRIKIENNNFLI